MMDGELALYSLLLIISLLRNCDTRVAGSGPLIPGICFIKPIE